MFSELTAALEKIMMLPSYIDGACLDIIERFVILLYDRASNLVK